MFFMNKLLNSETSLLEKGAVVDLFRPITKHEPELLRVSGLARSICPLAATTPEARTANPSIIISRITKIIITKFPDENNLITNVVLLTLTAFIK